MAEPAERGGAPGLARRARFRRLGVIYQLGDSEDVIAETVGFLAELPALIDADPLGDDLPRRAWAGNNAAWTLFQAGRAREALPLIEDALLAIEHDDENYLDTYVRILLATGATARARAVVERLLRSGVELNHLADVAASLRSPRRG